MEIIDLRRHHAASLPNPANGQADGALASTSAPAKAAMVTRLRSSDAASASSASIARINRCAVRTRCASDQLDFNRSRLSFCLPARFAIAASVVCFLQERSTRKPVRQGTEFANRPPFAELHVPDFHALSACPSRTPSGGVGGRGRLASRPKLLILFRLGGAGDLLPKVGPLERVCV